MDPLDRELSSLLSVEHSPEFRARVRTRIASEPAPRSWYLQWRVAGACAMACAVVMAVALGRVDRVAKTTSATPAMSTSPLPSTAVATSPIAVPTPRRAAVSRPLHREQEVLVAPSEVRGLRQLEALVREGRTHFLFAEEDIAAVSPEPVRDIVITPIAIAPLEAASITESATNSAGDEQ